MTSAPSIVGTGLFAIFAATDLCGMGWAGVARARGVDLGTSIRGGAGDFSEGLVVAVVEQEGSVRESDDLFDAAKKGLGEGAVLVALGCGSATRGALVGEGDVSGAELKPARKIVGLWSDPFENAAFVVDGKGDGIAGVFGGEGFIER